MTDYDSGTTPWNSYNSQINNIVIEDGVTSIGVRAFNSCTKLTRISIPASVAKIGHRAFFGCSSLAAITIPDAVTSIEEKTFDGCGKLATVTLGSGLKAIKNSAFNGNRLLATITLKAEVPPTLGTSVFAYVPVAVTSGDDNHTIAWSSLDDGTVRIVAYSLDNSTFDGETLLTLEVENADGTIAVDNVSVATTDGIETSIGGTSADVNGTTGIGGTAEEVVSVRYFDEAGAELDEPQQGINIVVTEYAGGRIESKKVLKK